MAVAAQNMPVRVRLDLAQEVESQSIASTLDTTQWTLHGRRNRVFVLVAGTGSIRHHRWSGCPQDSRLCSRFMPVRGVRGWQ